MNIIFGPISSRRFGTSLGIDLSPAQKCCNFDCLYCELPRAKKMPTITNPPKVDDIINELKEALKRHQNIDVITLTANGEPSLYPNLKELIKDLHLVKTTQKLLILSNATALLDEAKFEALLDLDIVKFSLDSAIQKTFQKIDRGFKEILVGDIINRCLQFRARFRGKLVIEILVVGGLNDSKDEFRALNSAISKISPDRVDISSIDRPPAYKVSGVSTERLFELSKLITSTPVVVALHKYKRQKEDFSSDEILKMLSLRPQSVSDVEAIFSEKSKKILQELLKEKIVEKLNLVGTLFYKIST